MSEETTATQSEAPTPKREKAPKRYRISYRTLMSMNISDQTREELIRSGEAEPSPHKQRIERVEPEYRKAVESIFDAVAKLNEQAGRDILRIQVLGGDQ